MGVATEDVEMKDVTEASSSKQDGEKKEEEKKDPELLTLEGRSRSKQTKPPSHGVFFLFGPLDGVQIYVSTC